MNIDTLIELLLRHVTPSTIVILFITGAMFSLVPVWERLIRILREPIPISHKIAVIGLPGAGKTTLITSLFELIQRGVHIPAARLHGGNTIRTVNKNVARLNAGQPIGPTTEDQTFVFRFSYKKGSKFLAHTYDVEIADFPGEYSDRISHQNSPLRENEAGGFVRGKRHRRRVPLTSELDLEYTLFNSEFFSWIASSREYLFLVDLASTYSAENVRASIADISARIRASWQVVEDAVSERGIGATSRREVHLVFTKLDSLFAAHAGLSSLSAFMDGVADISDEAASARMKELKSKIAEGGKRSDQSIIVSATPESISSLEGENSTNFRDLIEFFTARVRRVDVIYTSMALRESDGNRLGIKRILEAVLPQPSKNRVAGNLAFMKSFRGRFVFLHGSPIASIWNDLAQIRGGLSYIAASRSGRGGVAPTSRYL